jgi:hypothetical protein
MLQSSTGDLGDGGEQSSGPCAFPNGKHDADAGLKVRIHPLHRVSGELRSELWAFTGGLVSQSGRPK